MAIQLKYKIYSGGKGDKGRKAPPVPIYLFTIKNIFLSDMAQCILMCLAPGVTREKIHVGVNTLSNSINI